jgi:potassium-dependent mechanosensitive channel
MRASTLQTGDGAEVVLPNGTLIAQELTNWTLTDNRRRVDLPVSVAYGHEPGTILTLLRETTQAHARVAPYPAPEAFLVAFGDNTVHFVLRFWSTIDLWGAVSSEVYVLVNSALGKTRIDLPYPQRDLHLKSIDPQVLEAFGSTPARGVPQGAMDHKPPA